MAECPHCHNEIPPEKTQCVFCGFDHSHIKWSLLIEIMPPSDLIVESLLESCDIPVKLVRRPELPSLPSFLFPSSLTPVSVMVPEQLLQQAQEIIKPMEEETD